MKLQYDISVVGEAQVRAVLRGVEREIVASNRRLTGLANQSAGRARAAGAPTPRGGSPQSGWDQLGRLGAMLAKREEQARIAAERRVEREKVASARRAANAELREARRVGRERVRIEQQARRQFAAASRRSRDAMRSGLAQSVAGGVGGIARLGGAALSVAGGFGIANALQDQVAVRSKASQLANQAGTPALKGQLAKEAMGVRGFTGLEVLGGLEEFVTKTGDLDTARKLIGSLGELSLATGASLRDLGATAGQAFNVLKDQIQDPAELMKELQAVMGALAQQGALGAVEIRDLAHDFGKLGAATRAFEGDAPALIRTMGAFAQVAVARGGAESSADASTASVRLASDIVTNRKKFKALGVDIKSTKDPTKLKNPIEIIADVLEKTGGDIEKTSGLFGMESKKIFAGFGATFSEAEKRKPGSGRAAVMAEFERFSGANVNQDQLRERAASRLNDEDLKFKEAMKDFNVAMANELLPAVSQAIPQFKKLVPHMARAAEGIASFAKFATENPFSGIGAIVAASVAKDVASAGIGKAASGAIASALGSTAGIVISTLVAGIALAKLTVDVFRAEGNRRIDKAAEGAGELRAKAQSELDTTGRVSPETRKQLEELDKRESSRIGEVTSFKEEGALDFVRRGFNEIFGGKENLTEGFTKLADSERGSELIEQNKTTKGILIMDDVAKKFGAAADKLDVAADKIARNTVAPPRSGTPMVAR